MPRGVYARKPRAYKAKTGKKGARVRSSMIPRGIARRAFNPSPVFTETFLKKDSGGTNPLFLAAGPFLLSLSMADVTQRAQYSALYTKYKILSAKWILMPEFSAGSSDQNATSFNNGSGQPWSADARVAYSIQDSPNQAAPTSERQVLEDNGCRVRQVKGKMAIRHRPVPNLQLGNGVYETERVNPFINFDVTGGVDPSHFGIVGWISQTVNGAPPSRQGYYVYCKVTFQLKDPR